MIVVDSHLNLFLEQSTLQLIKEAFTQVLSPTIGTYQRLEISLVCSQIIPLFLKLALRLLQCLLLFPQAVVFSLSLPLRELKINDKRH